MVSAYWYSKGVSGPGFGVGGVDAWAAGSSYVRRWSFCVVADPVETVARSSDSSTRLSAQSAR